MQDIYNNGTYLDYNPTWGEESSEWKATQICRMLQRHGIEPASVCEVGCGTGGILANLERILGGETKFDGYEVSRQAYELAQQKSGDNLSFWFADFLTAETRSYDVLLVIDVVEHVEDYYSFLRGLRLRATHKLFHIPLDLSVQTVLRGRPIIRTRRRVGHLHYFSKETALATLEDTGYEIVDAIYTKHALELPNRGWKSDLLWLPRKLAYALHRDLAVRVLGGASLLVLTR